MLGISSNPSELSEKSNWSNAEGDHKKVAEDIARLKSAVANEDLNHILLKDDYQTNDIFDINIGVYGNFDDFSYEHSVHSKAFHIKSSIIFQFPFTNILLSFIIFLCFC